MGLWGAMPPNYQSKCPRGVPCIGCGPSCYGQAIIVVGLLVGWVGTQASHCNTWPELLLWMPWWECLVPGWLCTRPCCDCCGYTGGWGWLFEWLAARPHHDCGGYTGVWAWGFRMGATLKVYWCQPEMLTMWDGMGAVWQEPVRVGMLGRAGPSV